MSPKTIEQVDVLEGQVSHVRAEVGEFWGAIQLIMHKLQQQNTMLTGLSKVVGKSGRN